MPFEGAHTVKADISTPTGLAFPRKNQTGAASSTDLGLGVHYVLWLNTLVGTNLYGDSCSGKLSRAGGEMR